MTALDRVPIGIDARGNQRLALGAAHLDGIERDVRREDARQDNRDEEERAADEEVERAVGEEPEKEAPSRNSSADPSQRAHK